MISLEFVSSCLASAFKALRKRAVVFFLFVCLIFIGIELIYNVVLVSGVPQSESVIHIHISVLFYISFPYRLLQSIE